MRDPALRRGAGRARPPPHQALPRAPPPRSRAAHRAALLASAGVAASRRTRRGRTRARLAQASPRFRCLSSDTAGRTGAAGGQPPPRGGNPCPGPAGSEAASAPLSSSCSFLRRLFLARPLGSIQLCPLFLRAPPASSLPPSPPRGGRFRAATAGGLSMSEPARQRPPRRGCARAPRSPGGKEGARPGAA